MSESAVMDILQKIQQLSEEERLLLDKKLSELAEAEWQFESEQARRIAQAKGLDQTAIDETIQKVRYPS